MQNENLINHEYPHQEESNQVYPSQIPLQNMNNYQQQQQQFNSSFPIQQQQQQQQPQMISNLQQPQPIYPPQNQQLVQPQQYSTYYCGINDPDAQILPEHKKPVYKQATSRLTEKMYCPQCNVVNWTQTEHKVGCATYGTSGILGITLCVTTGIGGLFGFLPCCLKDCKDVEHRCSICQNKLGIKKFQICDS